MPSSQVVPYGEALRALHWYYVIEGPVRWKRTLAEVEAFIRHTRGEAFELTDGYHLLQETLGAGPPPAVGDLVRRRKTRRMLGYVSHIRDSWVTVELPYNQSGRFPVSAVEVV